MNSIFFFFGLIKNFKYFISKQKLRVIRICIITVIFLSIIQHLHFYFVHLYQLIYFQKFIIYFKRRNNDF